MPTNAPQATRSRGVSNRAPGGAPTYGDFVEAMRTKKVHGHSNGMLLAITRMERRRNWAIPSYDFGRLLDPQYPPNVLDRIPPDSTPSRPPKRDSAFLFTIGSVRQLLIQRFGVTDYPDDDEGPRFWFFEKMPGEDWLSMDGKARQYQRLWEQAVYLLVNPRFIEVAANPTSVERANQQRRMAGAASVPPTGVVKLARIRRTGAVTHGTVDGPPKRPHDRSGHQRRLRDGRVVKVRACEVHKGAVKAALHSVVRP